MRKRNAAITASIIALVLAGVPAGLTGCQNELDIATPASGGVGGGTTTGDGSYDRSPRIEIYWDGDETRNRAGETIFWAYDGLAATHPESPRRITGKVINAPAGYDYLVWTLTPETAVIGYNSNTPSISDPGTQRNPAIIAHFPATAGFIDTSPVFPIKSTPQPPGSSFNLSAGANRGNARLNVRNADKDDRPGLYSAYIDIFIADTLPPLEVFVMETKTATGVGFVRSGSPTGAAAVATPQWSVGDRSKVSFSAESHDWDGPPNVSQAGYRNSSLTLTGLQAGTTTYSAKSWDGGVELITAGALTVNASTTWYVGPGATGTYGFRTTDIVPLTTAMINMRNYYSGNVWPGKNTSAEWHAVLRFTGHEPGGVINVIGGDPAVLDLVNDSPSLQKTIGGQVIVGGGRTLTMAEIKVADDVTIQQTATLKMLTAQTEIAGGRVVVSGNLIMNNGTIGSAMTAVLSTGAFTLNNGTINNTTTAVEKNGRFTMNNGRIEGGSVTLKGNGTSSQGGGRFTMAGGTLNSNTLVVEGYATFTMSNGTLSSSTTNVQGNGKLTMTGGTLSSAQTTVQQGGLLTVTAARVDGNVDVYGDFTVNGGTFNSEKTHVLPGGKLTLKAGTHVTSSAVVHLNGVHHSTLPQGTLGIDHVVQ
ncbi:hypothetical protein FACS189468_4200 [Spirochaetia bacterium]|nr:hypothetical protein FACS189468_4200 [Spirochaetia bacterium]